MQQIRSRIAVVLMAFAAAGCASSAMRPVDPARAVSAPAADQAVVVFIRPSIVGGAIQSSVFDLVGNDEKLVGIVSSHTKVAYATTPGQHLFMVIGENADFMAAELSADRQYYALVTPRMGWWKARFSLAASSYKRCLRSLVPHRHRPSIHPRWSLRYASRPLPDSRSASPRLPAARFADPSSPLVHTSAISLSPDSGSR